MTKEPNQSGDDASTHPDHFVREWREFMGWSQEELAAMADVHHTKIGRVETGKRELKASFLKQLAAIFKVPPSALLEINPATKEGAQTAEWLTAWNQLTPDQRRDVLRMVRALMPNGRNSEVS